MKRVKFIIPILLVALSCREQIADKEHQVSQKQTTHSGRDTLEITDPITPKCLDMKTSYTDMKGDSLINFKIGDTLLLHLEYIGKSDVLKKDHEITILPDLKNDFPFKRIRKGVYQVPTFETREKILAYKVLISSDKILFKRSTTNPISNACSIRHYDDGYPVCKKWDIL